MKLLLSNQLLCLSLTPTYYMPGYVYDSPQTDLTSSNCLLRLFTFGGSSLTSISSRAYENLVMISINRCNPLSRISEDLHRIDIQSFLRGYHAYMDISTVIRQALLVKGEKIRSHNRSRISTSTSLSSKVSEQEGTTCGERK